MNEPNAFKYEVKCNDKIPAFKRRQQAAKAAVRMATGTLQCAFFGLNRQERRTLKSIGKQTNLTSDQREWLKAIKDMLYPSRTRSEVRRMKRLNVRALGTKHQRATLKALGAKAQGLAAYRASVAEAGQ